MGPHTNCSVDFELAKLHQHELRDERSKDRLARQTRESAHERTTALTDLWRVLARVPRSLMHTRRQLRGSSAIADVAE